MKYYIRKILFLVFDKFKKIHQNFIYSEYRKKYEISDFFKFNGEKIVLYGNGEIILGNNSYIGNYSTMEATDNKKIVIGNNTSISHNVRVYTSTKITNQDFNKKNKKFKSDNVIIGNGVWIGVNCVILPGVTIGDNAIIGANSVINKDIQNNSIFGGNPIKFIKTIDIND